MPVLQGPAARTYLKPARRAPGVRSGTGPTRLRPGLTDTALLTRCAGAPPLLSEEALSDVTVGGDECGRPWSLMVPAER